MKKKILIPLFILAISMISCNIGTLTYYDDIYTSSNDAQYQKPIETTSDNQVQYYVDENIDDNNVVYYDTTNPSLAYENSETYYDEEGNAYVTNNYYYDNYDNYGII